MDLWRSKEGFQHGANGTHNEDIVRIGGGGCRAHNLGKVVWLNFLGVTCQEKAKELLRALPKWSNTMLEGSQEHHTCPRHSRRLQKTIEDDEVLHVFGEI